MARAVAQVRIETASCVAKSLVLLHGHDEMQFTKLQANKQISILEEVDILQDRLGIWMELLVIGIPWRV